MQSVELESALALGGALQWLWELQTLCPSKSFPKDWNVPQLLKLNPPKATLLPPPPTQPLSRFS